MNKLPYFGELNLEEDFFETEFTNSNGEEISITIDFEGEKATEDNLKSIAKFLENVENNIQSIKNRLLTSDFTEEVNDYIEHHLSELKSEPQIQNIKSSQQFIEELKVSSINIYPSMDERFFAFDFTISEELTNHLLVVDLLEDLSISYITTES